MRKKNNNFFNKKEHKFKNLLQGLKSHNEE